MSAAVEGRETRRRNYLSARRQESVGLEMDDAKLEDEDKSAQDSAAKAFGTLDPENNPISHPLKSKIATPTVHNFTDIIHQKAKNLQELPMSPNSANYGNMPDFPIPSGESEDGESQRNKQGDPEFIRTPYGQIVARTIDKSDENSPYIIPRGLMTPVADLFPNVRGSNDAMKIEIARAASIVSPLSMIPGTPSAHTSPSNSRNGSIPSQVPLPPVILSKSPTNSNLQPSNPFSFLRQKSSPNLHNGGNRNLTSNLGDESQLPFNKRTSVYYDDDNMATTKAAAVQFAAIPMTTTQEPIITKPPIKSTSIQNQLNSSSKFGEGIAAFSPLKSKPDTASKSRGSVFSPIPQNRRKRNQTRSTLPLPLSQMLPPAYQLVGATDSSYPEVSVNSTLHENRPSVSSKSSGSRESTTISNALMEHVMANNDVNSAGAAGFLASLHEFTIATPVLQSPSSSASTVSPINRNYAAKKSILDSIRSLGNMMRLKHADSGIYSVSQLPLISSMSPRSTSSTGDKGINLDSVPEKQVAHTVKFSAHLESVDRLPGTVEVEESEKEDTKTTTTAATHPETLSVSGMSDSSINSTPNSTHRPSMSVPQFRSARQASYRKSTTNVASPPASNPISPPQFPRQISAIASSSGIQQSDIRTKNSVSYVNGESYNNIPDPLVTKALNSPPLGMLSPQSILSPQSLLSPQSTANHSRSSIIPRSIYDNQFYNGQENGQIDPQLLQCWQQSDDPLSLSSFQEIIPGIFLGSAKSALNIQRLLDYNITHILTIMNRPLNFCDSAEALSALCDFHFENGISAPSEFVSPSSHPHFSALMQALRFHFVYLVDVPEADLLSALNECLPFLHMAHQQENGRVLIHCQAGVSRSASVVCAYILSLCPSLSLKEALEIISLSRPYINPNEGFLTQLEVFLKRCKRNQLKAAQRWRKALKAYLAAGTPHAIEGLKDRGSDGNLKPQALPINARLPKYQQLAY